MLGGKNNGRKTETDNKIIRSRKSKEDKTMVKRQRQTNNNQKPLIEGGQNNGQKTETDNNQKALILGGKNNGRKTETDNKIIRSRKSKEDKTMVEGRDRQTIIRSR